MRVASDDPRVKRHRTITSYPSITSQRVRIDVTIIHGIVLAWVKVNLDSNHHPRLNLVPMNHPLHEIKVIEPYLDGVHSLVVIPIEHCQGQPRATQETSHAGASLRGGPASRVKVRAGKKTTSYGNSMLLPGISRHLSTSRNGIQKARD